MSGNVLLAVQSLLIFLQISNTAVLASVEHAPLWVTIPLSAAIGAMQYFVQHVGNQTVPPPPPTKL